MTGTPHFVSCCTFNLSCLRHFILILFSVFYIKFLTHFICLNKVTKCTCNIKNSTVSLSLHHVSALQCRLGWVLPPRKLFPNFNKVYTPEYKISSKLYGKSQVSQFTYLGCSISYQFSSDVESKLAKFLQLIGTIKRTILRKVRTETILKINNTLVLPTFLYRSENWTPRALQRRIIEAAEMKLLRPLAGYTLYDHKINDYLNRELRIIGILDKIDEYRQNWFRHLQRMPQNRIPLKSYHYRPQGRRTIGRPKKRWREKL